MKLFWTEPALHDLQNLRDYIANDSDIHAANFVSSILMRVERLEQLPLMGRAVPEAKSDNIREIIYRTYRLSTA
jgi:plasmid stabilization system protein ParE